jgi:RimJ/RimL family protein N-acetyltransferase/glycosyltransferase involved in cell wall biosynthesis
MSSLDKVFIRLLEEADAAVSWKWRNDPKVWEYTGSKPDKPITYEIELDWIKKVLQRQNEIRFAICEKETGNYIGNVQLTDINGYDAAFHIFIGDKKSWGSGYGTEATCLMLKYGFNVLKLQSIWLDVKKENIAAIKAYEKAGFSDVFDYDNYRRMAVYESAKNEKKISVFVMAYNHEKFIGETLEGILKQHVNAEFEIVVGDDFSKDNSRSIILDYAIKNPGKFKLLFYPKNLTAAINQIWVLKNCFGKYIALCEGDDYWTDPSKLQKQVDFLEANEDYAICFHRVYELSNGNEHKLSNINASTTPETYTIEDLANGNFIHTPSMIFRNGLIKALPKWFNDVSVGDYPLYMLCANHGKIKYFPEPMATYRIHSSGVWTSASHIFKCEAYIFVLSKLMTENFIETVKEKLRIQRRRHMNMVLSQMVQGDLKKFIFKLKIFSAEDEVIKSEWPLRKYVKKYWITVFLKTTSKIFFVVKVRSLKGKYWNKLMEKL